MALHRGRQPLPDRVGPNLRVLFVGINPGLRSAAIGHHFAGRSNRFWTLLADAGLVPAGTSFADDGRMPGWGFGITNLVDRPTRGVGDLSPRELTAGRARLVRKIRRLRPALVALVGVSVYRAVSGERGSVTIGRQQDTLGGAPIVVLPNPSGRNAHFSYAQMRRAYQKLWPPR
jgi:TDG/mug DNA glycosylase family protein